MNKYTSFVLVGLITAGITMYAFTFIIPTNLSNKVLYAHHQYTDFNEMLTNIRALEDKCTTEAWQTINPDMYANQQALARYSWQPSEIVEVHFKVVLPNKVVVNYRVKNNVVSADRLFAQEITTTMFKISSINRWELTEI